MTNSTENHQNTNLKTKEKQQSGFSKFVFNHKVNFILIIALLILAGWAFFEINSLENQFKKDKESLVLEHKIELNTLNHNRIKETAKIFSWAIRGELLRENKEQINLYFNEFIKNSEVVKLQLINPETGVIETSTDKNDIGTSNVLFSKFNDQVIKQDENSFQVITPISGLNKKIAVFVMVVPNLK